MKRLCFLYPELMEENSRITVSEISQKMGIGATTITKRIKYLKDQELVIRNGSKKSGQWVVNRKMVR